MEFNKRRMAERRRQAAEQQAAAHRAVWLFRARWEPSRWQGDILRGEGTFRQPSPVGTHAHLINTQNLVRDTMALAAFDDSGGHGGLRFRERRYFPGHQVARFAGPSPLPVIGLELAYVATRDSWHVNP
jgi:hypothetical protein